MAILSWKAPCPNCGESINWKSTKEEDMGNARCDVCRLIFTWSTNYPDTEGEKFNNLLNQESHQVKE